MTPDDRPSLSDDAALHVERDTAMTAIYIRVLVVEAVIVVALWYFGRMFS